MSWWSGPRPEKVNAPTWPTPDSEGTRVLVEHPDPAAQQVLADGLREHGYDVLTCGGPRGEGMVEARCPLLRQEPCPAVDGADVTVSGLPLGNALERTVIRRVARGRGAGSLIVQARPQDLEHHLDGVHADAVVAPLTVSGLVEALQEL